MRMIAVPRANQHWVEDLDFAIEEWTLDGVRLVEVLGRVHLLEMAHQGLARNACLAWRVQGFRSQVL